MAQYKSSKLLDYILDYIKGNRIGSGTITIEKFILAAMKVIDEDFREDDSLCEEAAALKKKLEELNAFGEDFEKALEECIAEIDKQEGFGAGLDFQRALYSAEKNREEAGKDVIDSVDLIDWIFSNPTGNMKKIIDTANGAPKKEPADGNNSVKESAKPEEKDVTKSVPAESKKEEPVVAVEDKSIVKLTKTVKRVSEALKSKVFGQDHAIAAFVNGYFQAEFNSITNKSRRGPRGIFLFAGPPGVGKTYLAENAAKEIGLAYQRFDMSEYANSEEGTFKFAGINPSYKSAKSGAVTGFVKKNPNGILLFDEIEKAHLGVLYLLYQILDAGRLRDAYTGEEIDFTDTILIFTTNAGRGLYEDSMDANYSMVSRKVILKALSEDINPQTGIPYFPQALCSRFSSGSVVMFNHLSANELYKIVKSEIEKCVENISKTIGIKFNIDENVYSSILFAEGGQSDARALKGRINTFINEEIFDLFRFIPYDENADGNGGLKQINLCVEMPSGRGEVVSLFKPSGKPKIVVYSKSDTVLSRLQKVNNVEFIVTGSITEAKKVFAENDVLFALVDIFSEVSDKKGFLDFEDVQSPARTFLRTTLEDYPDIPVYIAETDEDSLKEEEKVSFRKRGVRGFLKVTGEKDVLQSSFDDYCVAFHQQSAIRSLAMANKLLKYDTAQTICDDGETATITMFDLRTTTAVDPEDSKEIVPDISKPNVHFDDIIGAGGAIEELKFFVKYLKDPKSFVKDGYERPKGVLLYGPPGTGKTMLAKAMACECGVTFISAQGNQFRTKWVGEGGEKVRELFKTARKYAPSIVFIDEFDAIARARSLGGDSGDDEVDSTLTRFLTEMDGFENSASKPVFVLAATNFNAGDVNGGLDQAIMRRFDRKILIDLPKREDRARYLKLKLADKKHFDVSPEMIKSIAVRSIGMSLADLENVLAFSRRLAAKKGEKIVTDAILDEALDTVAHGEERKWSASELERTARHEAGHALLCWESGEVPSYLTIVARGNYGGYMMHDVDEEKGGSTREELRARIRTSLGGRAAEMLYYGDEDGISTGPSGDLRNATSVATYMICVYGMDEKFGLATVNLKNLDFGELSPEVRKRVNEILNEEMAKAIDILTANKPKLDALVKALMDKSHMTGDEIDKVLKNS